MQNMDQKVDMFWPQRLLKKHKNLKELKKNLNICLGYLHAKMCDDIIQELEDQNILDKYIESLWNLLIFILTFLKILFSFLSPFCTYYTFLHIFSINWMTRNVYSQNKGGIGTNNFVDENR